MHEVVVVSARQLGAPFGELLWRLLAASSPSSAKKVSKPEGEMISINRAGSRPALQNVCGMLRGLKT
jgi:hypothetical protein